MKGEDVKIVVRGEQVKIIVREEDVKVAAREGVKIVEGGRC